MSSFSIYPSARHTNLVVEELHNEILIYDSENVQASCLNPTAALVWKYADGKTSVSEIASKMSADLGSKVDPRVVYYALEQLDKRNLLIERGTIPVHYNTMSRRDFLVKAGIVGAAVMIPVIIAVTAPTPAMANTNVPCQGTCTISSECAPTSGCTLCGNHATCPGGISGSPCCHS